MAETAYPRTISTAFPYGTLDPDLFRIELLEDASLAAKFEYMNTSEEGDELVAVFDPALTTAEETTFDGKISSHDELDVKRHAFIHAVDKKTPELIDEGFEYPSSSGNIFSLSKISQFNIHVSFTAKDLPEFAFPIPWGLKHDNGEYSIVDAADMTNFFLTALGTVRGIRSAGESLKQSAREATTAVELDALEDNR